MQETEIGSEKNKSGLTLARLIKASLLDNPEYRDKVANVFYDEKKSKTTVLVESSAKEELQEILAVYQNVEVIDLAELASRRCRQNPDKQEEFAGVSVSRLRLRNQFLDLLDYGLRKTFPDERISIYTQKGPILKIALVAESEEICRRLDLMISCFSELLIQKSE